MGKREARWNEIKGELNDLLDVSLSLPSLMRPFTITI
jgi:hypothetical protein